MSRKGSGLYQEKLHYFTSADCYISIICAVYKCIALVLAPCVPFLFNR